MKCFQDVAQTENVRTFPQGNSFGTSNIWPKHCKAKQQPYSAVITCTLKMAKYVSLGSKVFEDKKKCKPNYMIIVKGLFRHDISEPKLKHPYSKYDQR